MPVKETHPVNDKVALVRAYNDALLNNMGDLSALRAAIAPFLTDHTVCLEASSAPWGGTWVGVDGFMAMFSIGQEAMADRYTESPETLFEPEDDQYVVDGDIVMRRYVLAVPGSSTQPPITMPCIERYVVTGERIDEIEVFFFDTAALSTIGTAA
jgi:hypothetical protein